MTTHPESWQRTRRSNRSLLAKALVVVSVVCFGTTAAAQRASVRSARDMYTGALAREQNVRAALSIDDPQPSTLADVHTIVKAYEAIVRQYPRSGYTDNALWQAGRLSLDAYLAFGNARDKTTAVRLLRFLTTDYPFSRLVKEVPAELARLDADPAKLATITSIRRSVLPDGVRVTIALDGEVAYHDQQIENPTRVFVDLASTRALPPLRDQTLRFDGDRALVRRIRIGRHPNHTTRVVLDAAEVTHYSVYALYNPFRLVIDCIGPPPAAARAPLASRPLLLAGHLDPVLPDTHARAGADLAAAVQPPAPALHQPAPPRAAASRPAPTSGQAPLRSDAPPATNLNGGFSMARQLGLGVSRIVIDPGHGGRDPGVKGPGIDEADLVLDIALRLEKLLQQVPGTEVILTRRTDKFVPLQERTAIANREGADLFLSIHANASPNRAAHGIETYFLNFASNMNAAAVAARENAASGQTMGSLPDFVKAIALNNKIDESHDFAIDVQRAMIARLKRSNKTLRDRGVKQAPFVVLIGAAMPSVLAEISFVTNPREAKLLKSSAYRQRIAEALRDAVRKYQTSLKRIGTVADKASD